MIVVWANEKDSITLPLSVGSNYSRVSDTGQQRSIREVGARPYWHGNTNDETLYSMHCRAGSQRTISHPTWSLGKCVESIVGNLSRKVNQLKLSQLLLGVSNTWQAKNMSKIGLYSYFLIGSLRCYIN